MEMKKVSFHWVYCKEQENWSNLLFTVINQNQILTRHCLRTTSAPWIKPRVMQRTHYYYYYYYTLQLYFLNLCIGFDLVGCFRNTSRLSWCVLQHKQLERVLERVRFQCNVHCHETTRAWSKVVMKQP
jgi:hypothetical protein